MNELGPGLARAIMLLEEVINDPKRRKEAVAYGVLAVPMFAIDLAKAFRLEMERAKDA